MARYAKVKFPEIAPKKGLVVTFPIPEDVWAYTTNSSFLSFSEGETLYFRQTFRKEDVTENTIVVMKVGKRYSIGKAGKNKNIVGVYYGRKAA